MLNECPCGDNAVVCPESGDCVMCGRFAPSALRKVQEASLRRFTIDALDHQLHAASRRHWPAEA